MVLETFFNEVLRIIDMDCFECRLLLGLCVGLVLVLGCVVPFLWRGSFAEVGSCMEAKDEVPDDVQESWRNQEWQAKVRTSCHTGRDGGTAVLVTGAAGFMGLHVCLALKKRGDGVVGLDNFCTTPDLVLKRDRQKVLEKNSVFVVHGDINDSLLLRMLFSMIPFTHVMHLAAQPGIRFASEIPAAYVHNNIAGLVTLLEACRRANPQPAFVWTSSSSVYGLNASAPCSESHRVDEPASLYAASKQAGEGLVYVYNHLHGLSTTTLRLGTVYGPWGRPDMAYWIFARDIIRGKEITIYEGPNQVDLVRDWTFIDDIVQGCLAAIDSAERSTGSGGRKTHPAEFRIFNLGCLTPVTVVNLVSILEGHLQIKAKVRVVEMPLQGSPPFMFADNSLAQVQLGYNPTTDPYVGLKKFIDWYLDYYDIVGTGISRRTGAF